MVEVEIQRRKNDPVFRARRGTSGGESLAKFALLTDEIEPICLFAQPKIRIVREVGSFWHTQMRLERAKKNIERANEAVLGVVIPSRETRSTHKMGAFVPLKNVELLRLGYRIREARKVLGYSQKGFAKKCNLDRSYLGGVERGERNLTFGVLCAICAGLTCDLAAITKGIPRLATPVFSEGRICFSSRNGNGPARGS